MFQHKIFTFPSQMLSVHRDKSGGIFGTLLYLEQPQKIRIQIISNLSRDYMANLQSWRSSASRSALDRALTSDVSDEVLFRNWQICVDQWLLTRKCH